MNHSLHPGPLLDGVDRLITGIDRALRTVAGIEPGTGRPSPAGNVIGEPLDERERRQAAALMRVDHAGEVAAQALYDGQALTARTAELRRSLEQAAREETDHLVWCRRRLDELGARTSRLDPLWYAGSYAIGAAAGLLGDRVSLGFLAETERQVVRHLDDHLERLPVNDERSRAILEQMRTDEGEHATNAVRAGAVRLPGPVRTAMHLASRVMTRTSEYV